MNFFGLDFFLFFWPIVLHIWNIYLINVMYFFNKSYHWFWSMFWSTQRWPNWISIVKYGSSFSCSVAHLFLNDVFEDLFDKVTALQTWWVTTLPTKRVWHSPFWDDNSDDDLFINLSSSSSSLFSSHIITQNIFSPIFFPSKCRTLTTDEGRETRKSKSCSDIMPSETSLDEA